MRVLITGSRTWDDRGRLRYALDAVGLTRGFEGLVVVHGQCPDGGDALADEWALDNADLGVLPERHPADWERHDDDCPDWHHSQPKCKRAGFRRNAEMVALGADLCLAFIKGASKGASMTADLAEKAGIETRRYVA